MTVREIKVRGKSLERLLGDNQWLYGLYVYTPERVDEVSEAWICTHYGNYQIIPETAGQYTGLKDRNGVEIYEGDIGQEGETIYVILWDGERARYIAKVIKDSFVLTRGLSFPLWQYVDQGECILELIGNQYEHPHLLPKEDE